jgi:hypothetical protein
VSTGESGIVAMASAELTVEIGCGTDEREVREGPREVAECFAEELRNAILGWADAEEQAKSASLRDSTARRRGSGTPRASRARRKRP